MPLGIALFDIVILSSQLKNHKARYKYLITKAMPPFILIKPRKGCPFLVCLIVTTFSSSCSWRLINHRIRDTKQHKNGSGPRSPAHLAVSSFALNFGHHSTSRCCSFVSPLRKPCHRQCNAWSSERH